MSVLPVFERTSVLGALRGQNRTSDLLEMEVRIVVNYHVGVRIQIWVRPLEEELVLFIAEQPLQFPSIQLKYG